MFFWLYAVIELLAIFMDSGIIPTANVSYPVSIFYIWSDAVLTDVSGLLLYILV
jgi:hypothetical protein